MAIRKAMPRTDEYSTTWEGLSGPRPLCRVADIVSKPRILDRSTPAVSPENQSIFRITGVGKDCDPTMYLKA